MSHTVSDIKLCLEYVENNVSDDNGVDILLYQEDSSDSNNYQEDVDGTLYTDSDDLPLAELTKRKSKNSPTASFKHTLSCEHSSGDEPIVNEVFNDETQNFCDSALQDSVIISSDSEADYAAIDEDTTNAADAHSKSLGKYQCYVCLYNTHCKDILVRHLSKHTSRRPHKCPVCLKTFRCRECLKVHINTYADIKTDKCVQCDRAFISSSDVSKHRRQCHNCNDVHKCTKCEYSTFDRHRLKQHMDTHTDDRPFKCTICKYSSASNKYFQAHVRIHTTERKYECDICHYCFKDKNTLKKHRLEHLRNNETALQCQLCPLKFRTTSGLLVHLRKVHKTGLTKRSHKCPHCDKTYAVKASLHRHIESHKEHEENKQDEE